MYDKNRIEDSLEFVRQMKEFVDSDDALDEFDPFADNDPDELFVNLAYHMEPEVPPKESAVQDSHAMGDSFGVPDAGVIQEQRRLAEERLRLEQEAARRKQAELERQKQLEEERRRLEEEAAKRRQAEQKRLEEERRRLEEEAAKRRQAELERQKQLEEERRRLEEETAKRRQAEQEQQKRLAEERRKLEQEAERRRQAELQEKQRQEAERKKIEEERKRLAEEQKKQEEARRQWEEERRKEQEEAKRKAAELAEKKRLEEERQRLAQEEARRKEAELAEKKRLEEERLRLAQEEARRKEAELAEKKRLEEERLRLAQEEARRKEAELAEKKRLEEERQRLAQEEARRKEAELAEKKRLEEERKRLAQEAERRRQAELQEKQRQEAERLKIEEERRRLAEEQKRQEQARRQLEKERQRLVEEQLQRELEEQRRVLAEQARQKAEAKAKKEAEEKERRRKLVQEEEQRKKELQAREEEQRRKEQEEKKQEEQRLAASTQNSKLPDPAMTADSPESEVELLRKRAEELKRQAEMATLEARMRQLQLEAEGISTGESIITPPTSASVGGTVANNTSSTGVAPAAMTAAGNSSMPMPMLSIPGVQPGAMASGAGQQTVSNQNAGGKQKLSKEEIDSIFAKELKKSGSDSSYQQRKMMLQKQAERLKRKREETGDKLPLELVKEKAVQAKDFTMGTAWKIREFVLDKMTDPENSESREKAKKIMTNLLVVMICIAVAFLVSSIVTNYVAHPTKVEGESMETTLTDGDTVIIQKLSYYFGTPDRYDVVVFPVYNSKTYFIKRVIGLPGETIQIEEGKVYINGKELEDDIYGKDEYIDDPGDAGEPITLASDEYFVLGDNRNMSTDSRSSLLGVIKKKNIAGKAWRRVLPFSKNGKVK